MNQWVPPTLYRTVRFMLASLGAASLVVVTAVSPVDAQVAVTTCGQTVSGAGALAADLDCSAAGTTGVFLEPRASLDLAGFTLTMNGTDGVECDGRCDVFSSVSGGTIEGADIGIANAFGQARATGIAIVAGGRGIAADVVLASNVTITDHALTGISAYNKADVRGSTLTGNHVGVACSGCRVKVVDSSITDGTVGVIARVISLVDVTVTGHAEEGVKARINSNTKIQRINSVKARRMVVTNNGTDGISMHGGGYIRNRVRLSDVTVENNGRHGVYDAERISVTGSSISNNGGHGIDQAGRKMIATLSDTAVHDNGLSGLSGRLVRVRSGSSLTGNGTGPSCGVSVQCADIATLEQPKVDPDAVCDTSHDLTSGIPGTSWGVCSLD